MGLPEKGGTKGKDQIKKIAFGKRPQGGMSMEKVVEVDVT